MRKSIVSAFSLVFLLSDFVYAVSATWNLNPINGDWNTAANWTPEIVPHTENDIATFGVSTVTDIMPTARVTVREMVFQAGASAFNFTVDTNRTFEIAGEGFENDSGVVQSFVIGSEDSKSGGFGSLLFTGNATAGNMTSFTNRGFAGYISFTDDTSAGTGTFTNAFSSSSSTDQGGLIEFSGNATADHATFVNDGNTSVYVAGRTNFYDNSSAGFGTFTNQGGDVAGGHGGYTQLYAGATAEHGTFTSEPGRVADAAGGLVWFYAGSTAGEAVLTAEGGHADGAYGGQIVLDGGGSDSGTATFIANGGSVSGALGGEIAWFASTGAGTFIVNGASVSGAFGGVLVAGGLETATLIANGGSNGGGPGEILPLWETIGARVELFGGGWLNFDFPGLGWPSVTFGSIEGDGKISLGRHNLTSGSNNLSTTFSGLIEGGGSGHDGSLTKIGAGNLTLTGANTYTGGTIVSGGILLANNAKGSGTGSGPVQVTAGTFGGGGKVSGAVTLGTGSGPGAFLGPGATGVIPGTLTIRKKLLLMADATYKVTMNSDSVTADKISAKGVRIRGAQILLDDRATGVLPTGTTFTVINNTAATPISGVFANLADGGTVTVGNNAFQANYEGGDGNDLTLTVLH